MPFSGRSAATQKDLMVEATVVDVKAAMPVNFVSGHVIYHHWAENNRLIESVQAFHSLDELLLHCLTPPGKRLVDRVTVTGRDAQGRRRKLVLSFQAVTEP
jgi:hypothetical protein